MMNFIEQYIEWIKDLLASPDGHADELRLSFMIVQVFYLVAWAAWLMSDSLTQWPEKIIDFSGGQAGLIAAFGFTVRVRGDK